MTFGKKDKSSSLMAIRILLFAVLVMESFADSRAALEFSAYLTSSNGSQFLLTDLGTGSKSDWLMIGDAFLGHVIIKFDNDRETLTIDQAGRIIMLPLKASRVMDGGPGASTRADIKVICANDGMFVIGGKVLNQLQLVEHFEELVKSGKEISLTIQPPIISTAKNAESTRKVANAFGAAGAKGRVSIMKAGGSPRLLLSTESPK